MDNFPVPCMLSTYRQRSRFHVKYLQITLSYTCLLYNWVNFRVQLF